MPLPLTSGMITAVMAGQMKVAILLQAQFASGPLFVWTGIGTLAWNSQSWIGIGTLGGISPIADGTTVEAKGISLTFSVYDATLLSDVMSEFQPNTPVIVYLACFDSSNTLIADPFPTYVGRMDQPKIQVDGQTGTIVINSESKMITMNNTRTRRYTDADQQIRHPGDGAFRFVNAIQNRIDYWGRTANNSNV